MYFKVVTVHYAKKDDINTIGGRLLQMISKAISNTNIGVCLALRNVFVCFVPQYYET